MSAVDGGGEGATWISAVLEVEGRLVYCPPGRARHVDPTYAAGDDRVGIADGFPLLVMSHATLGALNARLRVAGRHPAQ